VTLTRVDSSSTSNEAEAGPTQAMGQVLNGSRKKSVWETKYALTVVNKEMHWTDVVVLRSESPSGKCAKLHTGSKQQ